MDPAKYFRSHNLWDSERVPLKKSPPALVASLWNVQSGLDSIAT